MGWKVGDNGPMPEEIKKKMVEGQRAAAHKHTWHTGKKIDGDKFVQGYKLWLEGDFSKRAFAEYVGITQPALVMRMEKIQREGILKGEHFTDGKPVYYAMVKIGIGNIRHPKISRKKIRNAD